jgi:hypothetical protein
MVFTRHMTRAVTTWAYSNLSHGSQETTRTRNHDILFKYYVDAIDGRHAVWRDAAPTAFLSRSRSRKVARVPFNFVSRPYAPNKAAGLRRCDKYTKKVEGIGPMRIVLDTHLHSDIDDTATQRSEPESARDFCHISCKGQASRIAGARTGRREGRD